MAHKFENDRKVLIILLVLVVGYIAYMKLNGTNSHAGNTSQVKQEAAADTPETPSTTEPAPLSLNTPKQSHKDTLPPIRTDRYPGPPERIKYPKKLTKGNKIDLNTADTLLLMRVPGIGSSFARRIYKHRKALGGYYVVEQLQEVYGMDRERYQQIAPYMEIKTAPRPITISRDSIARHPYLQWRHIRVLQDLLRSGREISWKELMKSGQFTKDDSLRLAPYLPLNEIITETSHKKTDDK